MPLMKWSSVAQFRRLAAVAMGCASLVAATDARPRRRSRRPLRPIPAHPPAAPGDRSHHRQPVDCRRHGSGRQPAGGHGQDVRRHQRHRARRRSATSSRTSASSSSRIPGTPSFSTRGRCVTPCTCSPTCTPAIVIGDDPAYFDLIAKSAQTKTGGSAPDRGTVPIRSEVLAARPRKRRARALLKVSLTETTQLLTK